MRTYAEYLASMTVKTLHTIAKQGGYKGYSKLRQAELVAFIEGESVIDWDGALAKLAQDFTSRYTDAEVTRVAEVTFSEAPVSTEVQYGKMWNCCAAKPAKVVVFDNGARHAVCASCASSYTGEVQDLPTHEVVDGRSLEMINDGMGFSITAQGQSIEPYAVAMRAKYSAKTPVAPAESVSEAPAEQTPSAGTPEENDTAELVYAYRAMRKTINAMGNTPARVKIVGKLRLISAQLKAQGMRPACL
jgi:hypothetical protein